MSKADRTKQRIIEDAAPLFNKKGVAGTSVDDVLQVAMIGKRTFYKYFESKEVLSYEVTDYLLDKIKDRIEAAVATGSAKDKLLGYMEIYRYAYPEDPEHSSYIDGGCPILNFGVESDDTNLNILQNVEKTIQATLALLVQTIENGIKGNEFRNDFNALQFSTRLFSQIEGATMMCRVMKSNAHMDMVISMLKLEIESYELIKPL